MGHVCSVKSNLNTGEPPSPGDATNEHIQYPSPNFIQPSKQEEEGPNDEEFSLEKMDILSSRIIIIISQSLFKSQIWKQQVQMATSNNPTDLIVISNLTTAVSFLTIRGCDHKDILFTDQESLQVLVLRSNVMNQINPKLTVGLISQNFAAEVNLDYVDILIHVNQTTTQFPGILNSWWQEITFLIYPQPTMYRKTIDLGFYT